jgi:hypothetical protein
LMKSVHGLIVRLERADGPDRKLDAEVVAYVLGPAGAVLNPIEDIDGWGIDCAPDAEGEASFWMASWDVPGVTAFLDAAHEVVAEARPHDGAAIMARALRGLSTIEREGPGQLAGRAARSMMSELLRTMAAENAGDPIIKAA